MTDPTNSTTEMTDELLPIDTAPTSDQQDSVDHTPFWVHPQGFVTGLDREYWMKNGATHWRPATEWELDDWLGLNNPPFRPRLAS